MTLRFADTAFKVDQVAMVERFEENRIRVILESGQSLILTFEKPEQAQEALETIVEKM